VPYSEEVAWTIVRDVELDVDADRYRVALKPLVLAIVENGEIPRLERLARAAVSSVWDDEFAAIALRGLRARRFELDDQAAALDDAIEDVEENGAAAMTAAPLVGRVALTIAERAFCVTTEFAALEHELRGAPREKRRRLALRMAGVVSPRVGVTELDVLEAVHDVARRHGAAPVEVVARALATGTRREVLRRELARDAAAFARAWPLLAETLRDLVAEPVPADAADDELWKALVAALSPDA
jgi:hypothetical protein